METKVKRLVHEFHRRGREERFGHLMGIVDNLKINENRLHFFLEVVKHWILMMHLFIYQSIYLFCF